MPKRTEDEIKQLIADKAIFAITIDTAVVEGSPGRLDNTVVRRLDQFESLDIKVLFSEVVASEITRHRADEARETARALKKAMRMHARLWKLDLPKEINDTLGLNSDADQLATKVFDAFLGEIKGAVTPATEMPDLAAELLRRYFSESPPFGQSEKRKHEFPDAFALLTLEALAKKEARLLLCVSPDAGWQEFCDASEHMVCVDELEAALSYFNLENVELAQQIVAAWRQNEGGEFLEEIERAFEYRLTDLDFIPTGYAPCDFEAEPLDAAMQFVDPQSISVPKPIASDDETITFTVRVEAVVRFTAEFNFYAYDSVDHDSVFLNSEQSSIEERYPFELTITAERTFENVPIFTEVQVSTGRLEVDFGHLEPFPNENPTHEKY